MSAPSAQSVTELAPAWESVSVHEAGHAVIGALLGVEITTVVLDYVQVGLFRWEVAGQTNIGPDELDEHVIVPFVLAGLEAEALWISTNGVPLNRARAEVQGRHANRGDVDQITACLPESGLDLDEAVTWVHDTLLDQWQTVTYVAEALREQRFLAGADVARLV